jgi:hypothetical protein
MALHVRPWLVYLAIAFLGVLPLLIALLAGAIANLAKCELDEGSVHPCVIAGRDVGKLLYAMGVSGWFTFMTMPAALFLAMVYSVYLLVTR